MAYQEIEARSLASIERLVVFLIPPAAREVAAGDLCELHRSPLQYASAVLGVVPFIVISQIRRNANLPLLGLQAFLIFSCMGGFGKDSAAFPVAVGITISMLIALLLCDAYRPTQRPSLKRAVFETIAVATGVLIFSEVVLLGLLILHQVGSDWLEMAQLILLWPLGLPFLCAVRLGLALDNDSRAISDEMSLDEMAWECHELRRRASGRNRAEIAALVVATGFIALFHSYFMAFLMPTELFVIGGYALLGAFMLMDGAVKPLPAKASFLSLRAYYQHELARQNHIRCFMGWVWFLPLLVALHDNLIVGNAAATRPCLAVAGIGFAMLLSFYIGSRNRERSGRIRETVYILERMREKCQIAQT